jgi:hypothetical protein
MDRSALGCGGELRDTLANPHKKSRFHVDIDWLVEMMLRSQSTV